MRDVWINTIAGTSAGVVSTLIFHPVDTIRTRWQAADASAARAIRGAKSFSSIVRTFSVTVKYEGVRALYKGCSLAVCGSAIAWGLYFGAYSYLQHVMPYRGVVPNALYGLLASVATSISLHPLWMLKTHLQVDSSLTIPGAFRNVIAARGLAGLWTGIAPQILLTAHGGVQMASYEAMKSVLMHIEFFNNADAVTVGAAPSPAAPSAPPTDSAARELRASAAVASVPSAAANAATTAAPASAPLTTATATTLTVAGVAVASACAKVVAATLTNPLLLIKTRMQDPRGWAKGGPPAAAAAGASGSAGTATATATAGAATAAHSAATCATTTAASSTGAVAAGHSAAATAAAHAHAHGTKNPYAGFVTSAQHIYRTDGWRGFFRGVVPQLARVVPSACVTFVVYETLKKTMLQRAN